MPITLKLLALYTYDANGNKLTETLANGVVSTYTYNNANKITSLVTVSGNTTISSYDYSYYLDGSDACKVRNESGIIETTEYEYDGLKRLTEESVKVGNTTTDTYSYEYDDYGNRIQMTATGSEDYVTDYSYSDSNGNYTALLQKEVKTVESEDNSLNLSSNVEQTVYTYDANGNQITKTANGTTETNTYDGLNQLIGFTDGDTVASYTYDVSGLRLSKTVDGETTEHVWDGNQQIIADVVESHYYEANCYLRGTNLIATYNFKNGAKSGYTYYTQNAHGDVVNLTDSTGTVVKSYTYDAFGVEKNIDDSDTNAFRYCGEYYDAETGTIYLRARYYNPSTGRFISKDSYAGRISDPLSLNLYTYCYNNPLIYVDPSGHGILDKLKESAQKVYNIIAGILEISKNIMITAKAESDDIKGDQKVSSAPGCRYGECSVSVSLKQYSEDLSDEQKEANALVIYSYLSQQGWSLEAICGVLGNIEHESRLNPAAWQDDYFNDRYNNNCGYGLVQFTSAKEFLPKIGQSVESVDEFAASHPGQLMILELDYLIDSCQPGQGNFYSDNGRYGSNYSLSFDEFTQSTLSAGELALVFHGHYERSGDGEDGLEDRYNLANEWYETLIEYQQDNH